jgi:hypothetical protein
VQASARAQPPDDIAAPIADYFGEWFDERRAVTTVPASDEPLLGDAEPGGDILCRQQLVTVALVALIGEAIGTTVEMVPLVWGWGVLSGHKAHSFVARRAISQKKRRVPWRDLKSR